MKQQLNPASVQCTCAVRPPKPGDYDRMADLAGQLGYPCTGKQVQVRLDEMQDSNRYAVYVAELSGGHIGGWIGVYLFRAVETDACAEISGLIVDHDIRSCGVGKVLLDAVERWALSVGCHAISVRSNVKRDRAHGFYRENGYERTKTQESFCKILIEA